MDVPPGATWGLMGPEAGTSLRRTRTLGIASSIRDFNDKAVPGMGGVWYGKQLFYSVLGIIVAESLRQHGRNTQNIEAANAVEAIACICGLRSNGWKRDARIRGAVKLNRNAELTFDNVRKRGFYVTQPMRMQIVQPLPALGLVDANGSRFNSFGSNEEGTTFVEEVCAPYGKCYYSHPVNEFICNWAKRGDALPQNNQKLRDALSPLEKLSKGACDLLRDRVIRGSSTESDCDKSRRRHVLEWADTILANPKKRYDWSDRPPHVDAEHWHDMQVGAALFDASDAAIELLDKLEECIAKLERASLGLSKLPRDIRSLASNVGSKARAYLNLQHADETARSFCVDCSDTDSSQIVAKLVQRDDRVLRLRGETIVRGPAYRGRILPPDDENSPSESPDPANNRFSALPDNISYRVRNMLYLAADLRGALDPLLANTSQG